MRELEEKERRLRAIVEHVAEGIITIDAQGVIEAFNPAAAKMFGYPVDEVTSTTSSGIASATPCCAVLRSA